MRFYLPAHPFLRSFSLQITTGTTTIDTALLDTTTEGTATGVIVTGIEIVTTDATGTEDMTAIAIEEETTTGGLEGMKEDEDTGESVRRGLAQGAKTTCKLTALQRVTAVTVTEDEARNVAEEGTVWELLNEGAPPQQMRFSSP